MADSTGPHAGSRQSGKHTLRIAASDALKAPSAGIRATASDLMTAPYMLRPHQSAASAIRGMREHRARLAHQAALPRRQPPRPGTT